MARLSTFKDTAITGKIVSRMVEDNWRPPTALARLMLASGDEYEIRAIGEGKDWLMVAPLDTALTGTIKRSCVIKYEDKHRKYTGIPAPVMVMTKFPLPLKPATHSFETPLPDDTTFVSPCNVGQLASDTIFNMKAKIVAISGLEMVGKDQNTPKRTIQVEAADYTFEVTLLGSTAKVSLDFRSYAIIGLTMNQYMGAFCAQSTKLAWFMSIADDAVESKPAEDSPMKKRLKTDVLQQMMIRELLAASLQNNFVRVAAMLLEVKQEVVLIVLTKKSSFVKFH